MHTADSHRRLAAPARDLEALLTPLRAHLLNNLDTPKTMSEVAAELFLASSSATYQVGALANAGLVGRTRSGTTVLVHRTRLGQDLLNLYQRSTPPDQAAAPPAPVATATFGS